MIATRYIAAASFVTLSLGLQPLHAETPSADQPMINHVGDAVTQPVKDFNLKQDEIPPRLLEIQKAPYDITGLEGCRALAAEIISLRPMIGPDFNEAPELSRAEKRERGVSKIAGGMLGSFIPFRGIVREVTGANAAEQRYLNAISAGFARRSFLKGMAVSQGCIPPPEAS